MEKSNSVPEHYVQYNIFFLCHRGSPRHTYYTHKKYSHLRLCDELRHKELEESEERKYIHL